MVRRGHAEVVHPWLDRYMRRLEDFPRGTAAIGTGWREALGDPRGIADWTAYFGREVAGQPWRQVLAIWWPRLLPGVAAAATHGVIRVGHAVRALRADGEDAVHIAELAHGLAYWAARWQPVPGAIGAPLPASADTGTGPVAEPATAGAALAAVPRIAGQSGGAADRQAGWANCRTGRRHWQRPGCRIRRGDRVVAGRPGRRRRHQVPVLRARQRCHARALGDRAQRRAAHASRAR